MRKTSFGLGLAATIIAFLIGVIMLFAGIGTTYLSDVDWDDTFNDLDDLDISVYEDDYGFRGNVDFDGFPNIFFGFISGWLIISSVCIIAAGILGIIGICISRKRQSVGAGVMLLIAAILSLPSLYGFHAFALFVPAGVLAFLKDKSEKEKVDAQYETVTEEII